MAQQTAVEWLINHWKKLQSEGEKMNWSQIIQITELAKEMEKQQKINFANDYIDDCGKRSVSFYYLPHLTPEEYYNETFGK
ncbi:MAG: hypothetical protein WCR08_13385 [Gammaproteobacteria bacterium]